MPDRPLEIETTGAVVTLWLNRPAVHNALNEGLIDELTTAFANLAADDGTRAIVLAGRGRNFCSGADIESMRQQGEAASVVNLAEARKLAEMFRAIAASPKPTVARVHGAAIGGGLGLVAACDIAIASTSATFAASEVRLGLIPSTIAPHVLRAIGPREARRLFLTAERFNAQKAAQIGLVHDVVNEDELDPHIASIVQNLLAGAPLAQKAVKVLIDDVANRPITDELIEETAVRIARIRSEPEAIEGLGAFLEKRAASWVSGR
jgi:methylglutaconyl-CoA hydratase